VLVLSLFPGIGLLDMAFEREGFSVVSGPDLLWGRDVRQFHPTPGRFDGVIGGPPCQTFSRLKRLNPKAGQKHGNMIPEFERCVAEARPLWFVMENVPEAPAAAVDGYGVCSFVIDNRQCRGEDGEAAEQQRVRRFSFGCRGERRPLLPETAVLTSPRFSQTVTRSMSLVPVALGGSGKVKRTKLPSGAEKGPGCSPRTGLPAMLELQGLPGSWLDGSPYTVEAKRRMIGNGVPLPMGRAIARAVREAVA
jgi:DNA (cytosine-5)-methyltransferase 1